MDDLIVDLFAGPGGWDQGLAALGHHRVVGIEWDDDACSTATAAGHLRLKGDVAAVPPDLFGQHVDGLLASPPCQAFSRAGKGAGRDAAPRLVDHVLSCRDGWRPPPGDLCTDDLRADLTLQPLRWADRLRPRWVACEQVPDAIDLWHATAEVLRGWGYEADARYIMAANHGVPQTRKRAIMLARRDGPPVVWPEPTHHDPSDGMPLFGRPWVSMAEALGWTFAGRQADPAPTVTGGGGDAGGPEPFRTRGRVVDEDTTVKTGNFTARDYRGQRGVDYERPVDEPAPTVRSSGGLELSNGDDGELEQDGMVVNTGRDWQDGGDRSDAQTRPVDEPAPTVDGTGRWHLHPDEPDTAPIGSFEDNHGDIDEPVRVLVNSDRPNAARRRVDEPAPTMYFGRHANIGVRWVDPDDRRNDQTDHDQSPRDWPADRPATTVASRDLVPDPGENANRFNDSEKSRNDGYRIIAPEAGVLQTFPSDYPWTGNKTSRFRQVGNAVPPLLAAVLLEQFVRQR